ncbi:hypothetical protein [Marinomonas primoryensis]|uniref:Putative transmembrane protein n=1 Tax=Marinomonas primoryensis TaxID=178399 RepID=A0A859D4U3_9GAMM|nr:hypothetical protein [Marinomonas primoryensis]QKK81959.1 putative transmembrane protein [Marinomonas primoryensis]
MKKLNYKSNFFSNEFYFFKSNRFNDHLISALVGVFVFIPFLLLGASHDGFEDIEYSFVPLFEWFLRQYNGDFSPVNFLWELGWSAPLAHGAWSFPGNLLIGNITAKTYFFIFYSFHLYLCCVGFLGIARLYNSSRWYAVISALLLSFLPPQGWYIFVHDAPSVLATLQLVPVIVYLFLRLAENTASSCYMGRCYWYYSILLGLAISYLFTSGHPGMFYAFFFVPALASMVIVIRVRYPLLRLLKNLIPVAFILIVLSYPKIASYWSVYSIQSADSIDRIVYGINPAHHDFFWTQSIIFPFLAISKLNFESLYELYFYFARTTRYLPFLWLIFLFSILISRRVFFYVVGFVLLTYFLQNLFLYGVTGGSSGANHFFEGVMAASLIFIVSQSPNKYKSSFLNDFFSIICIFTIFFMIGQQYGFKKYTSSFLNSTSSSHHNGSSLVSGLEEYGIFSGDRIIVTSDFERSLRKQKFKHRYIHSTAFALDGIANVSMFGKGVAGEEIYKSWRQGYSLLTLEALIASLDLNKENLDFYLKSFGIKGVLDMNKVEDTHWILVDRKRGAFLRLVDEQTSFKEIEIVHSYENCKKNLSCTLQASIMNLPNVTTEFFEEKVLFYVPSLNEVRYVALPIRYHDNLVISSNLSSDIKTTNCAGIVCVVLMKDTRKISVTSYLNYINVYTLLSTYIIIFMGCLFWIISILRAVFPFFLDDY